MTTSARRHQPPTKTGLIAFAVLLVTSVSSFGETQIRGDVQAVSVVAQDARVDEVLSALSDRFSVRFQSSADLDKRVTGTFEGPLAQVISHILRGYNFVIKSNEQRLEVTLLGSGAPVTIAGPDRSQRSEQNLAKATSQSPESLKQTTVAAWSGAVPTVLPKDRDPVVPVAKLPPPDSPPSLVPSAAINPPPMPIPPQAGAPPSLLPGTPSAGGALQPPSQARASNFVPSVPR
jgi:hypothetical protein